MVFPASRDFADRSMLSSGQISERRRHQSNCDSLSLVVVDERETCGVVGRSGGGVCGGECCGQVATRDDLGGTLGWSLFSRLRKSGSIFLDQRFPDRATAEIGGHERPLPEAEMPSCLILKGSKSL